VFGRGGGGGGRLGVTALYESYSVMVCLILSQILISLHLVFGVAVHCTHEQSACNQDARRATFGQQLHPSTGDCGCCHHQSLWLLPQLFKLEWIIMGLLRPASAQFSSEKPSSHAWFEDHIGYFVFVLREIYCLEYRDISTFLAAR